MPSVGIAQAILLAQNAVFRKAAPQYKITPAGFLDYLLNNNKPDIISQTVDDQSGYIRDVKIRFKKRSGPGESSTVDNCAIDSEPDYFEQSIPSTQFRRVSCFFEWKKIEQFMQDALAMQTLPGSTPPTRVMTEVIDTMWTKLNGLIADIDLDLTTQQATGFGKNIVTGSNAASTINFPLNTMQDNLNEGITELLSEMQINEMLLQDAHIVGSGLINNFFIRQAYKPDQARAVLPQFHWDPYTQGTWGNNQFAVFEKDAVQFANICRFRGAAKSGRWGTSQFGTMRWPITDTFGGTGLRTLEFDFQAREIDCPTPDMVIGGAAPAAKGRGLVFDMMVSYFMVGIPATAYKSTDRLFGNNGTYRFTATNIDSHAPVLTP